MGIGSNPGASNPSYKETAMQTYDMEIETKEFPALHAFFGKNSTLFIEYSVKWEICPSEPDVGIFHTYAEPIDVEIHYILKTLNGEENGTKIDLQSVPDKDYLELVATVYDLMPTHDYDWRHHEPEGYYPPTSEWD